MHDDDGRRRGYAYCIASRRANEKPLAVLPVVQVCAVLCPDFLGLSKRQLFARSSREALVNICFLGLRTQRK